MLPEYEHRSTKCNRIELKKEISSVMEHQERYFTICSVSQNNKECNIEQPILRPIKLENSLIKNGNFHNFKSIWPNITNSRYHN